MAETYKPERPRAVERYGNFGNLAWLGRGRVAIGRSRRIIYLVRVGSRSTTGKLNRRTGFFFGHYNTREVVNVKSIECQSNSNPIARSVLLFSLAGRSKSTVPLVVASRCRQIGVGWKFVVVEGPHMVSVSVRIVSSL
jgi:hypothetical protein